MPCVVILDHPTAEMLYHTLRPEHQSMSLATVYKTMEILKNRSCKNFRSGDERAHYDWDTKLIPISVAFVAIR